MSRLRIRALHNDGVDAAALDIADGQCVAVHGPSGGGKTRLLRAIADLDPAHGEIWLDEQARSAFSAPAWRRRVTFVAAESAWWATHVRDHADTWRSTDLAALDFAPDVLDWQVERLSSGERQRLALARALAHEPAVLLLDEPSANLDATNTARVEQLLADWRTTGGGVLWVSHDAEQRARVSSTQYRVADGLLERVGE